jgi:AcrR family transcriptional regulator
MNDGSPLPDARTRVLNAAEAIVLARGVPALTLDAAAKFAAVSKGGLLYHFANKEALLKGLVDRIAGEIEADWQRYLAETPPGRAHATRAVLRWAFHCPPEEEARLLRRAAVFLAAFHHDPALIDKLRAFHARVRAATAADALPAGLDLAVIAACDGLFVAMLFQIWQPSPAQGEAIEAQLLRLIGDVPGDVP